VAGGLRIRLGSADTWVCRADSGFVILQTAVDLVSRIAAVNVIRTAVVGPGVDLVGTSGVDLVGTSGVDLVGTSGVNLMGTVGVNPIDPSAADVVATQPRVHDPRE
jgi:proteasome assembly chaperone (PAC2) family protein